MTTDLCIEAFKRIPYLSVILLVIDWLQMLLLNISTVKFAVKMSMGMPIYVAF